MGRFDKYRIDLKGMKVSSLQMEYDLDNKFFADIDGQEFQKGAVKVVVDVKNNRGIFDFLLRAEPLCILKKSGVGKRLLLGVRR